MQPNPKYAQLASEETVQKTAQALKDNGFNVTVLENGQAAREHVLKMIPAGAEVMTMTSMTLETIGLPAELNESGKYDSIRAKLMKMDDKTQAREKRKLAAAPDWVVGSAHAVTEDGHVLIASNTGSQLAAEVYTAGNAIWVIGTQKLVKDDDEGVKRIYEYCLPLEDVRAQKAYGMGSFVSKLLMIKKEVNPKRAHVILVQEKLGF
jgi:hypothetical protein